MSTAFPIVSWGNGTNVYEVNVRQYTKEGTLRAFRQHLPRLQSMGLDILWFIADHPRSVWKDGRELMAAIMPPVLTWI